MSKQDERDTLQRIIEVKRPAEQKVSQSIKTTIQKITTTIKSLFKKFKK